MSSTNLTEKKCLPCEGGVDKLDKATIIGLLENLNGWDFDEASQEIFKHFHFKDFYRTMGFVNAVAFMANQEGHHPDMKVGYDYCHIRYSTHAINGLSENDFICAAKVDALLI